MSSQLQPVCVPNPLKPVLKRRLKGPSSLVPYYGKKSKSQEETEEAKDICKSLGVSFVHQDHSTHTGRIGFSGNRSRFSSKASIVLMVQHSTLSESGPCLSNYMRLQA